jgi:hypothetical protein
VQFAAISVGALLIVGIVLLINGVVGGGVDLFGWHIVADTRDKQTFLVGSGLALMAGSTFVGIDATGHIRLRDFGTRMRNVAALLLAVFFVAAGTLVFTTTSAQTPAAGVPNVYGLRVEEALPKLRDAGYIVAATENVCSNSIRVAGIVRQVLAVAGRPPPVLVDEPPTNVTEDGRKFARGAAVVVKVANGSAC